MADTIKSIVSPNSCGHFILGGQDGAELWADVPVHESVLSEPLSDEEKAQLRIYLLRILRQKGVTIQQFLNRVIRGDEATNLKTYDLIGPGAAVARANIGTAWRDISNRANGERRLVDFTGCNEFRLVAFANLVGTGPFGMRVVRDSDSAVLYENDAIAVTGERELDTNWQPLPSAADGLVFVRAQAKSATAADDPVFGSIVIAVR